MALTRDEIIHLSQLSRMYVDESSLDTLSKQLSSVVDYFNELKEVNTDNTEETSQTTGLTDVFRADQVNPLQTLTQEEAISEAHEEYNAYFVVPQILNKE